jgi:hypothetical protein
MRKPLSDRQAMAYVAQHLKRGGFSATEGAELMGGLTPELFDELAAEAELTRPALCREQCTQRPVCPFCDVRLEIDLHVRSQMQ